MIILASICIFAEERLFYYDIHGCAWDIYFFHQTVYKSIYIRLLICTLLSPHIVGFIKWI
jgi:hypothetical protein